MLYISDLNGNPIYSRDYLQTTNSCLRLRIRLVINELQNWSLPPNEADCGDRNKVSCDNCYNRIFISIIEIYQIINIFLIVIASVY